MKLIVIEGSGDGVGKTTQFNLIKQELEKEYKVITHHFPSYNKDQGKLVENYLKGEYGTPDTINPYLSNSMYAIDRAITMNEIKTLQTKDTIILLDRYTTSSLIYQSAYLNDEEKNKFIDFVTEYEYNKLQIPKPDVVIFLHIPYEISKKLRDNRKENEGISKDIHETDLSFMKKVYDSSIFVSNKLNFDTIECINNGELRSIEDINKEIMIKIRKKI